jgi:hypothetical protein
MDTRSTLRLFRCVGRIASLVILGAALTGCLAETGPEPVEEEIVTEEVPTGDPTPGTGAVTCDTFVWGGFSGTRTANANWDYIQANIFAGSGGCTICHTGAGSGPSNLVLEVDQHDEIVTNQWMSGFSTVTLAIIEPGASECSFLFEKISTAESVLTAERKGSRMPLNDPPLSAADIQLIEAWIDEGAVKSAGG